MVYPVIYLIVDKEFYMEKEISQIEKNVYERAAWRRENGYIYVIECGEYYKIGATIQNIIGRKTDLQTGCPIRYGEVFCGQVNNHKKMEKKLHKLFKEKHHRGEWYKLSKEDIDKIKQIIK